MKNNQRSILKSFTEKMKSFGRNRQSKKLFGVLIAGVICITLVAICCVAINGNIAKKDEKPYYDTLDGNYADVASLNIVVQDGVGPFDTNTDPTKADYCNRPGNDSSDSNGIVRSYDTVFYQLNYTTVLKDIDKSVAEGFLWYKCILPLSKEQAEFDLTSGITSWIGKEMKSLSELEKSDENGYILTEENGQQTFIGKVLLVPGENNPAAIPGEGSFYIAVKVMKMYQDDIVSPSFSAWLDHSSVKQTKTPKAVKVTSQLRINVQLIQIANSNMNGTVANFDFTTGNDLALDKDAGKVYGVIRGYGITLQLYNDNHAGGRNLKGCEMPSGDITFDLNLGDVIYSKRNNGGTIASLFTSDGNGDERFKPLVWSFDVNISSKYATPSTQDAREINEYTWTGVATGVAPGVLSRTGSTQIYNFVANQNNIYCSGGGTWSAKRLDDSTVRVTVKDYYPVDKSGKTLDHFVTYPSANTGSSMSSSFVYFNPLDYDYDNPLTSISTACFTAGKLYVVLPLTDKEGTTLLDKYGEGTLSWNVSVNEQSLKVASQNAPDKLTDDGLDYRNQTSEENKSAASSYFPTEGSGYISAIRYSNDKLVGYDVKKGEQWNNNSLDRAPIGQNDFGIAWGFTGTKIGSRQAIYAANNLMKFDDEAFEVLSAEEVAKIKKEENRTRYLPNCAGNDNQYTSKTAEYTYFYAAKPDGTGWVDNDEMNNARTEDLVYYKTIEELEKDNKICVGVLLEFRNSKPPEEIERVYVSSFLSLKMKEDYDLVGKTFQTVVYTTIWNADSLGIDSINDTQEQIKAKLPASLINKNAVLPEGILIDCDANGKPKKYNITVYDEYGKEQQVYAEDPYLGDSLHIVGYEATVTKKVTNKTSSGEEKTTFNLNYENERTVNYRIAPSLKYGTDNLNFNQKASVVVVDTIPKGLIYNEDYKCVWPEGAEKYAGFKCTLTKRIEKSNGDTELTWTLDGVNVGKNMPYIEYTCNISTNPEFVRIGDSFTNTVTIAPIKDGVPVGVPIDARNGNIATAAIKVTGLSQISFSKFADKPVYDAGDANDPLSWTMYMGNNSSATYVDDVWLDVLPYDGDENGSSFAFPLKVTKWTLYGESAPNTFNTWEVYYTTDVKVRKTNASAYSASGIRAGESGGIKWKKLTLTFDGEVGSISGLPQEGDLPTALVVIGNLDKKEIFKSSVAVDNSLSSKGEILVNRFSRLDANVSDKVCIVSRSISGLVWWDKNFDGLQGTDEQTITTGVKVTLMQLNANGEYEPFMHNGKALTVPVGTRISGLTGKTEAIATGSYDFIELPAGTYAVRFEADNNEEFKKWSASPKNVAGNSNDTKDSDATPIYDRNERLLRTDITGIILPSIEHSADGTTYISTIKREHNDSGLYAYTQNLQIKKVDSAVRAGIEGVEFTLYRADVDSNKVWTPIDSTATIVSSDADGKLSFNSLEPGHYILKETKSADGYHLPNTEWKLTVGHSGIPTLKDDKDNVVELNNDNNYVITNDVTTIIPLTGGVGTDIFYVVGALLFISVAIVFVCQRKRRAYR